MALRSRAYRRRRALWRTTILLTVMSVAGLVRKTGLRGPTTLARVLPAAAPASALVQHRRSSTRPAYDGHIPLNWFENAFLAAGSAFKAITDPRRGGEFSSREMCQAAVR
jgi:hypothetical protein